MEALRRSFFTFGMKVRIPRLKPLGKRKTPLLGPFRTSAKPGHPLHKGPVAPSERRSLRSGHPLQFAGKSGDANGSVQKSDRGIWEVRVYLGRDAASGKKNHRSRTVPRAKRDADRACRDLVAEVEAVKVDSTGPESVSLASWLDEWLIRHAQVSSWRGARAWTLG